MFFVFLVIGLPVFFGLLAAPGILLWLNGQERDIGLLYRNVYNGIDSFPLMAIPFFMLVGELINRGGITDGLVEFAQAMMGHLRGGFTKAAADLAPNEPQGQVTVKSTNVYRAMQPHCGTEGINPSQWCFMMAGLKSAIFTKTGLICQPRNGCQRD